MFKTVIYDNGQKILSDQMEQEFQLSGILAYKITYVKNMILLSERGILMIKVVKDFLHR